MSRDALNDTGVTEVYNCLVRLGNEELSKEIVKEVSPYLDSIAPICAIIFSVRLCAKFAGLELLQKMLAVLEKSMKGYFDGHSNEIEREICQYVERVKAPQSLHLLLKLLKMRPNSEFTYISDALASVLDTNPSQVEDIFKMLSDEQDIHVIGIILQSFEKMDKKIIDVHKLLQTIPINWWSKCPTRDPMYKLLVKYGELSKPVLFELLRENEKYDFALRCLKEIGISKDELSAIFTKPPMLQIYDFFYGGCKKFPKSLDNLWKEKEKLGESIPGKFTRLDHLLLHIFAGFNFVTFIVDPSDRARGADIICFYPETLDLLVIGCTTGILKDDLTKIDALIRKIKVEMPDLCNKCSITPIVVSSEIASISPSDAKYSAQNNIVVMQSHNIDTLLEMLNTNRTSREVIEYIKSCKLTIEYQYPNL
jgi:hypothetical protein